MTTSSLKNKVSKKVTQAPSLFNSHDMSRVVTIILGGGQGSRLYPLTRNDCKPAVTFGGKYRLIDVPMSNSINSGCHRIFIVTQFLSKSLHDHIFRTYRPGTFTEGFIEILSVEEKPSVKSWFQGTADAIRQNVDYLMEVAADYFLILSGDQLYQMNFKQMMDVALETDADLVIASLPVEESETNRLGLLQIDSASKITDFIEKPSDKKLAEPFKVKPGIAKKWNVPSDKPYLASMGIYLFKRKALLKLLISDLREDFGKHLIPTLVKKGHAAAYVHQGYWDDIGTIESYYNANMALAKNQSHFDCYNERFPIQTKPLNLPPPRVLNAKICQSVISEGSIIEAQEITNSIIGPRSKIGAKTIIRDSYISGHDFYHPPVSLGRIPDKLEIGRDCHIEKTIVDKHVSIGNNVQLINKENLHHLDSDLVYIRDGIMVVPRGTIIPDNFTL